MKIDDFASMGDYQKALKLRLRAEYKQFMWQYKSDTGCMDCGNKNPVVLQFHHRGGRKSKRHLSMMVSIASAKMEMKHCDLLCANCHLIRHHNEKEEDNG